jgi:hypothetical protein
VYNIKNCKSGQGLVNNNNNNNKQVRKEAQWLGARKDTPTA